MSACRTIDPIDLANLQAEGGAMNLIDVRSPSEYSEQHAVPAINLPTDCLSVQSLEELVGISKEDPIYLICRTGKRSQGVCQHVAALGYIHVYNVKGGTDEWAKVGLPTRTDI